LVKLAWGEIEGVLIENNQVSKEARREPPKLVF
jgi:hypothetical protein